MTHRELPPHFRLLLLAAQPGRDRGALELCLREAVDWDAFLELALHHRVAPLVYLSLEHSVPERVRRVLRADATRNAQAAVQAAAELRRLSEALPRLVALKGITLSERLYRSPNARHVGDLDVLVDLPVPLETFRALGYEVIAPVARFTPRRLQALAQTLKDMTLEHAATLFELDVHWRLFNSPRHPANALLLLERTRTTVYGMDFETLGPDAQFLYVTAHALSEGFTYLKALADVSAFLRRMSQEELDRALRIAREMGLLRQISAAIHFCNAAMLTEHASPELLPAGDKLALRFGRWVEDLYGRTDSRPVRNDTSPAGWSRLELLLTPGPGTVVEQVRRFAMRPRLWGMLDWPDQLFFLYWVAAMVVPPRRYRAAGQSQAAPRTPEESPKAAGRIGESKSPPKT